MAAKTGKELEGGGQLVPPTGGLTAATAAVDPLDSLNVFSFCLESLPFFFFCHHSFKWAHPHRIRTELKCIVSFVLFRFFLHIGTLFSLGGFLTILVQTVQVHSF